jgi:hypothetical protein
VRARSRGNNTFNHCVPFSSDPRIN